MDECNKAGIDSNFCDAHPVRLGSLWDCNSSTNFYRDNHTKPYAACFFDYSFASSHNDTITNEHIYCHS